MRRIKKGKKKLSVKDALKACRGIWEDRKGFDPEVFLRSLRGETRAVEGKQKGN